MGDGESGFGPWLRRKLRERQLSLAQVCRRAGCDYTYLWRILHAESARGRRYTRPSYALTRRVGEALGSPLEALAAAGYVDGLSLEAASRADRLARIEQDLAALRAELHPGPAGAAPPAGSGWESVRLPLLGHIRAGDLHEALDAPGDWIDLPEEVARGAVYALRVRGDSMHPTLFEGDLVTIRPQLAAEPGQLVVAEVEGEVTLKRYEVLDGVPTLVADNPEWPPVRCGPCVRVLGVVTGSYRPPEVLHRRPR